MLVPKFEINLKSDVIFMKRDEGLMAFKLKQEMEKEKMIEFANEYAQAVMGGCLLNPTEFYNETFKPQ
jgi:hypothetical protein